MRARILTLWAAFLVLPLHGAQRNTAGVQGVVTVGDSTQPLGGVAITVRGSNIVEPKSLQSDKDGRFVVPELPPGTYSLDAMREGYARPTTIYFNVTANQVTPLKLKLLAQGAISGRVTGMPGQGVVQVLRVNYSEGVKVLRAVGVSGGNVDDRGQYRLFGLDPGQYYIAAVPTTFLKTPLDKHPLRTYFRSETDPANAIPVTVRPGAEVRADIAVQSRASVSLSGRVISPLPQETVRGRGSFEIYTLIPQGSDVVHQPQPSALNVAVDKTNGNFELAGIVAGRYDLYVRTGTPDTPLFGHMELDVQDRPLKDLVIPLALSPRIEGRVVYQDQNGKGLPIPASTQVRLVTQGDLLSLSSGGVGVPVGPDGQFTLPNVMGGVYRVIVSGTGYIEALRQDGVASPGKSIIVGTRPTVLDVTFVVGGHAVKGSVRNWQQVSESVGVLSRILLVPDPPRRQDFSLYRATRADTTGRFTLSNVAPGEYKIFAWEHILVGAEQNNKFLSEYESRGVRVRVQAPASPEVQVDMIRSQEAR
jgi:hypothetical protein